MAKVVDWDIGNISLFLPWWVQDFEKGGGGGLGIRTGTKHGAFAIRVLICDVYFPLYEGVPPKREKACPPWI